MSIVALYRTLKFIAKHPLNQGHALSALSRYFKWQLGSRLLPGGVLVPFVEGTRLIARPGMTGATGNIYCGLHEFEDMALVLHALRPGHLFVDIGANVGAYSILAGGACGAEVIAVEPIPATFSSLLDNIRINRLDSLITAKNIGVGAEVGEVLFTDGLDTVNHVIAGGESASGPGIPVPVETLDGFLAGRSPCIIKIDVEGYETQVLQGAGDTLSSPGLLALILELNGSGARYGYDYDALHKALLSKGFSPCLYRPFERQLLPLKQGHAESGNTLYVKDRETLARRVLTARDFSVHGRLLTRAAPHCH